MTKISNNFIQGKVNKDYDERLTPNGQLTDAENFFVSISQANSVGAGENVLGNKIIQNNNIVGGVVIHAVANDSKETIYYLVSGDLYDYIIEYNNTTKANTIIAQTTKNTGALKFNSSMTISGSQIISAADSNHDDLYPFTDGVNPPRIININRIKQLTSVTPIDAFTSEEISAIKPSPFQSMTATLVNVNTYTQSNFIEDKFLSFAYRYKYTDGYYSAISSWSEYAFTPKKFKVDYQTFENLGMVNSFNAVDLTFNTGGKDVIGVDLLFKESNGTTVYVINKFIKAKQSPAWADNITQSFQFNNSKIYSVLPQDQYFRSFDNVPTTANVQAIIGNRIAYADYTEQRNIPNPVSYTLAIDTTPLSTASGVPSLHSNRDLEVGIIYIDPEGRKTTALVTGNNSIYVPVEYSDNQNRLKVTLSGYAGPTWANRYKFVIKQSKTRYETIYSSLFYEDTTFRWVKLESDNKNKVKEGDVLIVKSDLNGPLDQLVEVKVIAIETKTATPTADLATAYPIIKSSGLYMKIKQEGFNANAADVKNSIYSGYQAMHSEPEITTSPAFSGSIKEGTYIDFLIHSDEFSNGNAWEYKFTGYSSIDYSSFHDYFMAEIATRPDWQSFDAAHISWYFTGTNNEYLFVRSDEGGYSGSGRRQLQVTINTSYGSALTFETKPLEDLSAVYYETPETFTITNGIHQQTEHILSRAFNCFSFGNGAESYQIKDAWNAKELSIDFTPTSITSDEYKEVRRFADITYSGVFQESTSVNKLNEFNLSQANYKEDIEKQYGPIRYMHPRDTNVIVIQEDKWSYVLYGKDLLYNADASTNLSKISNVLGQQVMINGEYGISNEPKSFDFFGHSMYCTDTKRGVVLRVVNDQYGKPQIAPISNQGMIDYYKSLFRDNTILDVQGCYDGFYGNYILNIKYTEPNSSVKKYVTWTFNTTVDGWICRQTFNPQSMIRLNTEFITFSSGNGYIHNYEDQNNYNTFYGIQYPSIMSFNMNEEPSTRKVFRTLSLEGNHIWDAKVFTDKQNGYVNQIDFIEKEGVYYAYIRGNQTEVDTSTLALQGLGNVTNISGNNVSINIPTSNLISVGDTIYDLNLSSIGSITGINNNVLTLNSVTGLSNGSFIMSGKSQSAETSGLLGYYMNVTLTVSSNKRVELYAVNSEVSKSFM